MFINLHVHDAKGSLLDSILTVKQAVTFAKEHGQKAIALTNHGYMSSFVDFVKECNEQGVKPLIGNEIYEVDDMWEMADTKDHKQPRYHLVLIAKTQEGFQNLMDITSVSCTEGFYKKPRIDFEYIREHGFGKGIICLTACQVGRLSRMLVEGDYDAAERHVEVLKELFDDVYIELQSHGTESQIHANRLIYKFAIDHDMPYVITTDAHMLDESVMDSHAVFVQIGESREVGETYQDCWLQDEDEVHRVMDGQFSEDERKNWEIVQKGIDETVKVAGSVEEIDIGLNNENQMPIINVPKEFNSEKEWLRYLVFKPFNEKFGHLSEKEQQIRRDRLNMELDVLDKVHYNGYFLFSYLIAREADKRHIPRGYGRGSSSGCLCLYMLNVTQIDSILFKLSFSRFANIGRTAMAD